MKSKDIWFNIWFETRWHLKQYWMVYVVTVVILSCVALAWFAIGELPDQTRPPAVVTVVAEGIIVGVRATGSFDNWCRIELKFEDGNAAWIFLSEIEFAR